MDDLAAKVKQSVDIVSVISRFVNLTKMGINHKGLCPFHGEKTPSFVVNSKTQSFKCFGCGIGGDVFTFLMEQENITFRDALEYLAKDVGINLPQVASSMSSKKEKLVSALSVLSHQYQNKLIHCSKATNYLSSRSISAEAIKYFEIGYAPDEWHFSHNFLKSSGYSDSDLIEIGVLIKNEKNEVYDRFRDRLMFPLRVSAKEIVGFSARDLSGNSSAKYINSPTSELFHKSKFLYNFYGSRKSVKDIGFLILCEGVTDVIALWMLGFKNSVATLGTAFTSEHAQMISTLTNKVILLFDGDNAGITASEKIFAELNLHAVETHIVRLSGKDPAEMFQIAPEELVNAINNSSLGSFILLNEIEEALEKGKDRDELLKKALSLAPNANFPSLRTEYKRLLEGLFKVKLKSSSEKYVSAKASIVRPTTKMSIDTSLLLAIIFCENLDFSKVALINEDWFETPFDKEIFNAIISVKNSGKVLDINNVNMVLSKDTEERLHDLLLSSDIERADFHIVEGYIMEFRKRGLKRLLLKLSNKLKLYEKSGETEKKVQTQQEILQITKILK